VTTFRVNRAGGHVSVVEASGTAVAECTRFLEGLRVRGLSPFTVEARAYDLALLLRWLYESELTLGSLAADDVHRFLAWERNRLSHPRSINRRLNTLRQFYRFVLGSELPGGVEENRGRRRPQRDRELGLRRFSFGASRQLRVKEPRTVVEPLTIEQVRALLTDFNRYRDLCIAYLMLLGGLRTGEVLQLSMKDIDFEDRRLRLHGKGNKQRLVPLPKLLVDLLGKYFALERPSDSSTDRVFVILQGKRRGQPMTRPAVRRVFRTRRARPKLGNANPHRLRHTFGTDMARSGVRLPILQKMMGHAFPDTTLQYINLSMVDVASEFHRAIGAIEARYLNEGEGQG
jgi:site-specific recombinase XerD